MKSSIFDMPVHPSAEILPMMEEAELDELAADIKAKGLLVPLVVKDGVLIDGRNRREACRRAGVTPTTVELDGQDPNAYILSANIVQRHLSKGQRAMAAAMLTPEISQGGRGKKNPLLFQGFSAARLSQARLVLQVLPGDAQSVLGGSRALNDAYREALAAKKAADAIPVRLERLKADAPDLYELVTEEALSLPDAESALDERKQEAERQKRVFFGSLERSVNVTDWMMTESGREEGIKLIRDFPNRVPFDKPKEFFKKLGDAATRISEEL